MAFLPGLTKAVRAVVKSPVGRFVDKLGGSVVSKLPGGTILQAAGRSLGAMAKTPAGKIAIGTGAAIGAGVGFGARGGGQPALPSQGALVPYAGQAQGGLMQGGNVYPPIIDSSMLGTYYRAPRHYVIVRDPSTGAVYGMLKQYARAMGYWRPARKPPISAGDWHKYQTAKAVEKRLLKIARHGLHKRHISYTHQQKGKR